MVLESVKGLRKLVSVSNSKVETLHLQYSLSHSEKYIHAYICIHV